MGGIDTLDWSIQEGRIKIEDSESVVFLYLPIGIGLIIVNANVLYCEASDKIILIDYRRIIAQRLISI